jgi:hypothetical protein
MRTSHGLDDLAYAGASAASGRRPRPQHRAPRSRTGAAAVLLTVGLTLVLSGPGGPTAPAFAATDEPTISFIGDGLVPLACSSTPSVPNMTVKQNTRVVLANFIGTDATAAIGEGRTVALADGKAISVKPKAGSYIITMTPDCLDTYDVGATVITVVRSEVAPTPSPSAPAPTDPVGAGSPLQGPGVGDTSMPGSGPASSLASLPTPGTLAGGGAPSGVGVGDLADPDSSDPDVRKVPAVPPDKPPDGRGNRLLALIAAICVFGVTSAIIRAIVTQRATGALGL